jgi:hypothetical protein
MKNPENINDLDINMSSFYDPDSHLMPGFSVNNPDTRLQTHVGVFDTIIYD